MTDLARFTEYFTRSAEAFDSLYGETAQHPVMRWINARFRSDIYERFARSLAHFQRHGLTSCLDVGCGSGRYARALAETGLTRVLGVDVSPTMIELARRHTAGVAREGQRIDFLVADFGAFQTDERFDTVLAMGFFDYVRNPIPLLEKMRDLANHSVVASFPSYNFYRTPIRALRYRLKRCPVYFYDDRHVRALGVAAGFRSTRVDKIPGAGMDYFATFVK
jgi:2-polyprenyl-3-methyl-5-hydroxy-6-metoxy-1,4-benzoquinol methylase